jgi:hypothetical protein
MEVEMKHGLPGLRAGIDDLPVIRNAQFFSDFVGGGEKVAGQGLVIHLFDGIIVGTGNDQYMMRGLGAEVLKGHDPVVFKKKLGVKLSGRDFTKYTITTHG